MKLYESTVHELHEQLQNKQLSSVELTKAVYDRIEEVEDKVGAYVTLDKENALAQAAKVDALICGGIGMGAQMALAEAGIKLYAGVQGQADEAAKALAEGTLEHDPNARCDHHGHHHDGDCGHDHCADHHCQGN